MIIALSVADKLKIFRSIDDAILFLKDKDSNSLINELEMLRIKISENTKLKAVKITEENDIIEYDDLEDLKRDQ